MRQTCRRRERPRRPAARRRLVALRAPATSSAGRSGRSPAARRPGPHEIDGALQERPAAENERRLSPPMRRPWRRQDEAVHTPGGYHARLDVEYRLTGRRLPPRGGGPVTQRSQIGRSPPDALTRRDPPFRAGRRARRGGRLLDRLHPPKLSRFSGTRLVERKSFVDLLMGTRARIGAGGAAAPAGARDPVAGDRREDRLPGLAPASGRGADLLGLSRRTAPDAVSSCSTTRPANLDA